VDGVFATYSITPARAEKIAFAGPYLISGAAIMVAADNTDITSVDELAGKTVTTQTNSTSLTALQDQVPTATLQPYTNDAECVAALTQGRADAYVIDQSILISDAIGNPAVKVVGEPFTVDPYGIGVTKDDPSAKELRCNCVRRLPAVIFTDFYKRVMGPENLAFSLTAANNSNRR